MNAARQSSRDLLWLLLVGAIVVGAGIGLRDPWPADEPLHALIARTMLASGDWLIPMVGGDFFQDKPPLMFWLQAIFFRVTGSEQVGFLLPSLLAGLGTLVLVYDLGRRLWNRQAGWHAAWLLLFAVQFVLQARRGQLDALLMFCTFLSLYCLLRQLLLGGGWWWAVGAGLAAGLGTLTKVVGFLSFFVLIPWLFAVWRGWPGVKWQRPMLLWLASFAAWCVVVGAWLLPIWLRARHDPAVAQYLHELVVTQTFGRYVAPWHHFKPAWYYLQVMATLWLPLIALLPWLVPRWRGALQQRDARTLLLLGFVLLYLLFFTASSGKRDVYILPALPVLALLAGPWLAELLPRSGVQRLARAIVGFVAVACLGIWCWLGFVDAERGQALLAAGGVAGFAPLLVLGVFALLAVAWAWRGRAQIALGATLGVAWLIVGCWVFPQMDGQRSARNFSQRLESIAARGMPLGLLAYPENLLWQLHRPTVNFGHRRFREGTREADDAAAWLAAAPERQLLVPAEMFEPCFSATGQVRDVGKGSGTTWYLVSGVPQAACVARGDAGRALAYQPPERH